MTDIKQDYSYASTAADLYKALSEENGVRGWWTPDSTMETKVGTKARIEFKGKGFFEMEVLKLEQDKQVAWRCTDAANPSWIGSNLEFDISEEGNNVNLNFIQTDRVDDDSLEMDSGIWQFFLGGSLKAYLETGTGTPGVPEGPPE